MRGRGRQFGLLTPSLNPVSWAAFVAASEAAPISRTPRSPGLTALTQAASIAPSEAAPISCPTQVASVTASETVATSETGSRLGAPFSSPEWTVGQAISVTASKTGSISRTPPPTQATSVAAIDPRRLIGDQCIICLVKDAGLRKCKNCSARMHPSCQEELQQAAK
jgi:hypothetical protein